MYFHIKFLTFSSSTYKQRRSFYWTGMVPRSSVFCTQEAEEGGAKVWAHLANLPRPFPSRSVVECFPGMHQALSPVLCKTRQSWKDKSITNTLCNLGIPYDLEMKFEDMMSSPYWSFNLFKHSWFSLMIFCTSQEPVLSVLCHSCTEWFPLKLEVEKSSSTPFSRAIMWRGGGHRKLRHCLVLDGKLPASRSLWALPLSCFLVFYKWPSLFLWLYFKVWSTAFLGF